jgi:hypothetical protein
MFKSATWLQLNNSVKTLHRMAAGIIKKVVCAEGLRYVVWHRRATSLAPPTPFKIKITTNPPNRVLVGPGCRGRVTTSLLSWNPPPSLCTVIFGSTPKQCAARFVPNLCLTQWGWRLEVSHPLAPGWVQNWRLSEKLGVLNEDILGLDWKSDFEGLKYLNISRYSIRNTKIILLILKYTQI